MNLNNIYARYGVQPTAQAPTLSPAAVVAHYQAKTAHQRKTERLEAVAEVDQAAWASWLKAYSNFREEADYYFRHREAPPADLGRGGALVAQLSDVHFGALIHSNDRRRGFSLEMASKRLRLYAQQVLNHQLITGADQLIVALTGDMLDSRVGKERQDKFANAESTSAEALAHGTDLVVAFIRELAESEAFGRVRVVGISGNEARHTKDVNWGATTAPENGDCHLNANLVRAFSGSDVELEFDVLEKVIDVEGERILLIHGHQQGFKHRNRDNREKVLLRHGATFGICGHVHETMVDGNWARSASLCGTDDYADHALQVGSRASQNLIHVHAGRRNVTTIDLDQPGEIEGYKLVDYRGAFGHRG